MDRRSFLGAAAGLALSASRVVHANSLQKQPRPNILLICTDQQFAGAMRCAGNPDLQTPAMDAIAQKGVRFEKAYCPQPLCVPSRVSMFSGRYPHEAGAPYNRSDEPDSVKGPLMGKILKDGDYTTGYVGKWHMGIPPSQKALHGFDYMNSIRNNRVDFDIPAGCEEFLQRDHDQPFLLVASFVNPHDICEFARGQALKNGNIPWPPPPEKCPELPPNFEIPAHEPTIIRDQQRRSFSTYPTLYWKDDLWRTYRWAYNRMIEMVDGYIGQVLDSLDKSPYADNTVIIFTSDHGDGYGAHKWNQKQVLYDESARVPFIVADPNSPQQNQVNPHELINTGLDLIPTLCDYAEISTPDHLQGTSIRAAAENPDMKSQRDHIVIETEFCGWNDPYGIKGRCIRSEQYKYIVYDQGEQNEQLFHMENDPGEMHNLAVRDSHRNTVSHHRTLLTRWIQETDDTFQKPS